MLKIGITGGIGSGKTTVCKIFACLNVPVYNADERAKHLSNTDPELKKEVIAAFGSEAYTAAGEMNRAYMAQTVFPDPERLQLLNSFIHPAVAKDFEEWAAWQSPALYVLKEAALLVETGSYKLLDGLITVTASESVRTGRIQRRDPGRSAEQIADIMARQLSDEEKLKVSHWIITNDDTAALLPQVMEIDRKIRLKALPGNYIA